MQGWIHITILTCLNYVSTVMCQQRWLSKMNLNIGNVKFLKKIWDKMTTNVVKSFNTWLKNECHHSTCSFLVDHMTKLGVMLVNHKAENTN